MFPNRCFVPAVRRGMVTLALLLAGPSWSSGFCDSTGNTPAGTNCHQVRSTTASPLVDSEAQGTAVEPAYSYRDFPIDADIHALSFTLKLDAIGLLVLKNSEAQMRVLELGVDLETTGRTKRLEAQKDGRAMAFTLVAYADGSRAVRIEWIDAVDGASPSLNWGKPALVLGSVTQPIPAETRALSVDVMPSAPGHWNAVDGQVKFVYSWGTSNSAPQNFHFGTLSVTDVGRPLYLLSGVVAGDLDSIGMTTVFDYTSPLKYLTAP